MAEVIPIQWDDPEAEKIAYATETLRRGELIAIPTDTLYCILADPFNLAAVSKVFKAKSRAWDRSLPMFVESVDQVAELARHLPSRFFLLAHRYWPGPLSIIVEASGSVPLKVTGNTGRLSVREPASPIALRLLRQFGMPLIATSANLSGFPTCKEASEVLATLGMHLSLILDSPVNDSRIATTVDLTVPKWRLIRAGAIPEAELREFLGE
ncbi:MAG TPA: L-threonylcarbamoyladenylate synthase [Terriglobia bacterium]|nr:L-threonylcarbamoyladenylate synthase [Terriglobia bacterium]